jgi:hypothetical protein
METETAEMRPEPVEGRSAPQWREVDIAFAGPDAANPYTELMPG